MKKSIIHFCTMLLLLLGSALFLGSCKAQLPPQEPIVINHDHKIDSVNDEKTNKAIEDKTIIPVVAAKSNNTVFDSVVNSKVDEVLSKLNYQKTSGDNSLTVKYDVFLKQLEINTKIGETVNKKQTIKDTGVIEIPVIKKIPFPVVQPLTKLQKILIALGVGTGVFYFIKLLLFAKNRASWV